jgi:hypothetical protein
MECETLNGLKNGKMIEYYKNGSIKVESNWVNDTINGYSIGYYESGNIEFISSWLNGELHGDYVKYDEMGNLHIKKTYYFNEVDGYEARYDHGILKQLNHYIKVGDSSYLNQYINYDKFGSIKAESSKFYTLYDASDHDTVQLNNPVEIWINLSRALIVKNIIQMQIVTGDFDGFFNIIDEKSLDTVLVKENYSVCLTNLFDKPGEQSIKGIILYSYMDKDNIIIHDKMYFSKYFYVKDN